MAVVNRFNVNKEQVTLDPDIIENMSANDVSYDSSTQYDENTVGDKLSKLSQGSIYDVTANNNGATFASLSELLSNENLSILIPSTVRCGGMSIRFIQGSEQSSDNKYVQYRLMNQNFSTTVSDWQGVDDVPVAGSENLVKSGGVRKDVENIVGIDEDLVPTWVRGKRLSEDGRVIDSGNSVFVSDYIEVTQEVQMNIKGIRSYTDISMPCVVFFSGKSQSSNLGYKYVGTGASKGGVDITEEIETLNAKYIRLSHYSINDDVANVRLSIFKQSMFTTHEEVDNSISDAISLVKQVSVEIEKNTQFPNLLYGHTEYVNNRYLANGRPAENQNWCSLLSYVPVDEGETYAINRPYKQGNSYLQYLVCFYDTSKAYLSSVNITMNSYFSVPTGAVYIRMSITNTHFSADGEDNFDNIFLQKVANGYQVRTIDANPVIINGFPKTTLFGKKWALFGDSITEKNFRSNVNYHDYIRCETNIITSNYGIGGSGYKNLDDGGAAIYQRLYALREELSDYDIITIMAGVNDCTRVSFNSGIGDIDDVFTGDNYTTVTQNSIFACFKKSIELVFEYAPLTHIAIISPLPAVTAGFTFNPSDNNNRMSVFVNGCKELCAMYGIPYLDLYHQSGLRPWDDTVNQQLFKCMSSDSPDRLHPNEYGHKWIYPMIREFIKKLL